MRLRLVVLATAGLAHTALAQTAHVAEYHNPVWSPDGRSIAFESNRDGKFAIYVVSADSGSPRRLTSGVSDDVQPGWSPDGRRIVFASERNDQSQLYMMDADGANQQRITNSPNHRDFYPSFSSNGQSIVLGAQDVRNRSIYYVDVVRVDGTGRRELTDSTYVAEGPRWTADGMRIVFSRAPRVERRPGETAREMIARRDSARQTVSVRPDGLQQRIGRDAEEDLKLVRDPAISPDSRWIAGAKTVGGVPGIYVREIATGRERLVTATK